ncbi:nuclear factor erythroid 2-related factor 3-like isoform X1 [Centruroides vittatus]|uniref:nuclear factor erythroid 2-related factor 3-like isoform X1 n=1 Tax=Centruroides vittatus TaxID=120091 RepID=UPI00350EED51
MDGNWDEINSHVPLSNHYAVPLLRPSPIYGQTMDNHYMNNMSINGPMYHGDVPHDMIESNYIFNITNGHQPNVGSAIMSSYSTLTNDPDNNPTVNMTQANYEHELNYCNYYNSASSTNNNINNHEDNMLTELITNSHEQMNLNPNLIEMAPQHHGYEELARPSTSRDHIETSNDSLGSERIRSSEEWIENCPDQLSHNGQDFNWMKQGFYPASFASNPPHDIPSTSNQITPQKKHHMYGRKCYPYDENGMDLNGYNEELRNYNPINYNNYPGLPNASELFSGSAALGRATEATCNMQLRCRTRHQKDKKTFRENGKLSKDEKKAKENEIPLTMNDIVNLPIDEFNDRLSKHELNDTQLSLARDIRRRGKNKVAAQNCRKRKLDQIVNLQKEFSQLSTEKESLIKDNRALIDKLRHARESYNRIQQFLKQIPKVNCNYLPEIC